MKYLSLAALGAALIVMSGCVAYPVNGYPALGDRGTERDGDNEHDRHRNRDGTDSHGGQRHDNNDSRG